MFKIKLLQKNNFINNFTLFDKINLIYYILFNIIISLFLEIKRLEVKNY